MDGPTAAKEIRALGYDQPIVGCTGNGLESDIRHFTSMGASHVLVKPINLKEFEEIMMQ
jgi:CheY-like chemotaxis protein